MNILFITYKHLSVGEGGLRSVSFLRALADAGHQVDVVAAGITMPPHDNIRILAGGDSRLCSRRRIRFATLRAMSRRSYTAVHAVDEAIIYVARLSRLKRTHIVYEAARCFTGANADAPSFWWKLFPTHYHKLEKKILRRTSLVFSSCSDLTSDLGKLVEDIHVMQIEDVPAHALFSRKELIGCVTDPAFESSASFIVVCSVLPGNEAELRTLLLSARKVIERIPDAGFIFKGMAVKEGQAMAANLDIERRCLFLNHNEPERFLVALGRANAALFVPEPGRRYMHVEALTLLNSQALVVAIQETAYQALLNDGNCIQVDYTATAIADGLLRALNEPLIAYGLVADAQQLIADRHSFSSFKHRIRMAYHAMTKS